MESAQRAAPSEQGATQQAAALAGDAREQVSEAMASARAQAGDLKTQLADAMDSSAGVIRQRASAVHGATEGEALAGGGPSGAAAPQLADQGELVATALERGAAWLRENDLSDVEARVLYQLEEHPVRTLGIAALVGFLVARRT